MTEQTKRFIAVSDIVGLRFECAHDQCGATLVLPFKAESLKGEALTKCPSCGLEWAVEHTSGARGRDSRQLFKSFVETAKLVSSAPVKFSFSLEIGPSDDTRSTAPRVA